MWQHKPCLQASTVWFYSNFLTEHRTKVAGDAAPGYMISSAVHIEQVYSCRTWCLVAAGRFYEMSCEIWSRPVVLVSWLELVLRFCELWDSWNMHARLFFCLSTRGEVANCVLQGTDIVFRCPEWSSWTVTTSETFYVLVLPRFMWFRSWWKSNRPHTLFFRQAGMNWTIWLPTEENLKN